MLSSAGLREPGLVVRSVYTHICEGVPVFTEKCQRYTLYQVSACLHRRSNFWTEARAGWQPGSATSPAIGSIVPSSFGGRLGDIVVLEESQVCWQVFRAMGTTPRTPSRCVERATRPNPGCAFKDVPHLRLTLAYPCYEHNVSITSRATGDEAPGAGIEGGFFWGSFGVCAGDERAGPERRGGRSENAQPVCDWQRTPRHQLQGAPPPDARHLTPPSLTPLPPRANHRFHTPYTPLTPLDHQSFSYSVTLQLPFQEHLTSTLSLLPYPTSRYLQPTL